jgi:L-lactate utilization protein LutB
MDFLYPNGFDNSDKINSYFVAATIEQIHFWNTEIQKNNQNRSYTLYSKNEYADIDDPYNNLKHSFLCENLDEKLNNHDVPIQKLILKIYDRKIAINIIEKLVLTKNRKVIIKFIDYNKLPL